MGDTGSVDNGGDSVKRAAAGFGATAAGIAERLVAEAPYKALHKVGAHFVLADADKAAIEKGWQDKAPELDRVLAHRKAGGLVGIIPASIGAVVLDYDGADDNAARLAVVERCGVPVTMHPTSKPGRRHFWYRHPGAPVGNNGWQHGELRGDRGYVILWQPATVAAKLADLAAAEPLDMAKVPGLKLRVDGTGGRGVEFNEAATKALLGLGEPADDSGAARLFNARLRALQEAQPGHREPSLNAAALVAGRLAGARRVTADRLAEWRGAALRACEANGALAKYGGDGWFAAKWEHAYSDGLTQPLYKHADARVVVNAELSARLQDAKANKHEAFGDTPGDVAGAITHCGWKVRYNERRATAEFRWPGADDWGSPDDSRLAALVDDLAERCFMVIDRGGAQEPRRYQPGRARFDDGWKFLAGQSRVDPVIAWLDALKWDGRPRLDTMLHDTFGAEQDAMTAAACRLIVLGAVQRTFEPGCRLDESVVLFSQGEGVGKSALLQGLVPDDTWYEGGATLSMNGKEWMEATGGTLIVELSEMVGVRRTRDVDALKARMTARDDGAHRAAYDRTAVPRPRRFVMVCTTNSDTPLPPGSDNRRFVVIDVSGDGCNVERWLAENRDQLWAEAVTRYRAGERANLPRELQARQRAANRERVGISEISAGMVANLPTDRARTLAELMTLAGIEIPDRPRLEPSFADALRAAGWRRIRHRVGGGRREMRWGASAGVGHPGQGVGHPGHPGQGVNGGSENPGFPVSDPKRGVCTPGKRETGISYPSMRRVARVARVAHLPDRPFQPVSREPAERAAAISVRARTAGAGCTVRSRARRGRVAP